MRKLAPQGPPGAAHDKDHVHHQQLHFLFLLSHLTRDKGSVRPSDLSTAMHITRGAVTHTLNVMESTGLILRKTDPSDRRNVLVTITPVGQGGWTPARPFLANMQNLVDHLGEEASPARWCVYSPLRCLLTIPIKQTRTAMKKLMIFLKPYRWWILLSMLLLMLRAITEVLLPRLMAEIVDQGIVKNNQTIIYNTGLLMLAVAFSGAILAVFNSLISSKVSTAFSRDLRAAIFSHVERFSLNEFNNFGPATLITRVTNDVTQLQMVTMMLMRIMVMAPMMAIGSLIMAFSQNLKLSLVILGAILVLAVFIALQISYAAPLFKIIQQKIDQINLVLRENLTGVRVIRAFNREERESQRFDHANTEMTDILIRINRIMSVMFPGNMIIMNLGVVGLVWFGARLINISEMRVGTLMSFIQYAGMTMFSVVMVSFLFMMIPRAQARRTYQRDP